MTAGTPARRATRKATRKELNSIRAAWKTSRGVTLAILGKALGVAPSTVSRALMGDPGVRALTLDDLRVLREAIESHRRG